MNIEKIWHGLQSSCAHRNSLAIHMLSLKIGYTYEYTPKIPKMTISKRLNYGFTIHFLAGCTVPTFFLGPAGCHQFRLQGFNNFETDMPTPRTNQLMLEGSLGSSMADDELGGF
jgi:hypothetical protein